MDEPKTEPKNVLKPNLKSLDERITVAEYGINHLGGKVAEMDTDIKGMKKVLYGDAQAAGILERLRNIENDMVTLKKVGWATFIILLGAVLAQLYNIFITHPLP